MKRLFAVVRGRGPAWNRAAPLEEQGGWRAHAAFMNGLAQEGFVVTGGPLGDNGDTLLIVRAESESESRARLTSDPWGADIQPLLRTAPWQLRLAEEHRAEESER